MNSRKPICERFAVISNPPPYTTTAPGRSGAFLLTMP
jgi:hypothetical protein